MSDNLRVGGYEFAMSNESLPCKRDALDPDARWVGQSTCESVLVQEIDSLRSRLKEVEGELAIWKNNYQVSAEVECKAKADLAASREREAKECEWVYNDNNDVWVGKCGIMWTFNEGGIQDNKLVFCPKCGCKVSSLPATQEPRP